MGHPEVSLASVLPPVFLLFIVVSIWSSHVYLHIIPNDFTSCSWKDIAETLLSQAMALMMAVCYYLSAFTNPGTVPETLEWRLGIGSKAQLPAMQEVKNSTGEKRRCKRCMTYKPDRCHHCRVCKTCVLRMDHHCPWINNCIGFRNHKYFMLLVFYSMINCAYICTVMTMKIKNLLIEEHPSYTRYLIVNCAVFSGIMGGLMFAFLCFHIWLATNASTTIEFCEKRSLDLHGSFDPSRSSSSTTRWDRGSIANLKAVLGPQPALWLLPLSPPEGDGLSFAASYPEVLSSSRGTQNAWA